MGECSALLEIYLSFTGYLRWAENDGEHIAFGCSLLTSSDDCQRNPAKSMKVKGYEKQWKAPTWLTVAKRREWMGCWGLLGWLLIVSQWIIPSFPAFSTDMINQPRCPEDHAQWRLRQRSQDAHGHARCGQAGSRGDVCAAQHQELWGATSRTMLFGGSFMLSCCMLYHVHFVNVQFWGSMDSMVPLAGASPIRNWAGGDSIEAMPFGRRRIRELDETAISGAVKLWSWGFRSHGGTPSCHPSMDDLDLVRNNHGDLRILHDWRNPNVYPLWLGGV